MRDAREQRFQASREGTGPEAPCPAFWAGTRDEYFHLYDVTVVAVKSVDDRLRVGGPASAAVAWIDETLDHVARSGAPIDFVSTHTYGYECRHRRLDHDHSDLNAAWNRLAAGRDWPDDDGWRELAEGDVLVDLEPAVRRAPADETITMRFTLPMPAVSLIELDPVPDPG